MLNKNYKLSPEHRAKLSVAHMGHKVSPETRAKISMAFRGRKLSLEHRTKIAKSSKERMAHTEARTNLSAKLCGRKHTEEAIAKRRGVNNCNWKGGRFLQARGYVRVKADSHPFADQQGYVFEHRLVMETHVGRVLLPTEVVHHVNGITDDNRIENLMLFPSQGKHLSHHWKGVR